MDDDMTGFWLAVAFMLFAPAGFALFVAAEAPWSTWHQARQAIAQCEAQLPRDMHCVVTAAPE